MGFSDGRSTVTVLLLVFSVASLGVTDTWFRSFYVNVQLLDQGCKPEN